MRRTAVVLLLIMPMAHSSAMMPKMASCGGIARHGDHVEAHGAHAGHGLQLLDGQRPVLGRADHAGVLGHGDEGAGQAAHGRRRHDAALLHGVVQHGERRRGAGAAALAHADGFQDLGHGIALGGRGGQRQVQDALLHAEARARPRGP